MSHSTLRTLKVISNNDVKLYTLTQRDYALIKIIMTRSANTDEYPEEVNTILDKYQPISVDGVISTDSEGWGWWDPK